MSADNDKKRSKRRFASSRGNKRFKGARELEVGMQGIIITCNMNERKCTQEAYSLLNEYADVLYGPEKIQECDGSNSEAEDDAEAALKKEVAQLKQTGKAEKRFQALDSGANNVVFVRTHHVEPDKLVHNVLSDLHATKKKKSRNILRMLPVSGTCKAFQEDMEKYLTTFLEPWFKTPNQASYQVAFKARNSTHNKRDDIIKSIAVLVGKLNPENKVDLTQPELTIIVEVIKTVCCVSVVPDYTLYRKYNLQEVVKEDAPKADAAHVKEDEKAANQVDGADGVKGQEQTDEQGEDVMPEDDQPAEAGTAGDK